MRQMAFTGQNQEIFKGDQMTNVNFDGDMSDLFSFNLVLTSRMVQFICCYETWAWLKTEGAVPKTPLSRTRRSQTERTN